LPGKLDACSLTNFYQALFCEPFQQASGNAVVDLKSLSQGAASDRTFLVDQD
jgi:hypothetical protein